MSFETDVSGLTIGRIFKGQAAHDEAGGMQLKWTLNFEWLKQLIRMIKVI